MKFLVAGLIGVILSSTNALKLGSQSHDLIVGCGEIDRSSGKCTQCFYRWVLQDGKCIAVNDQCKTWDNSTADCTSCYDGWELSSGKCVLPGSGSNSGPVTPIANCRQYNEKGECTECNFRWVVKDNTCVAVSDQCKTWDNSTALCTSCYDGWNL